MQRVLCSPQDANSHKGERELISDLTIKFYYAMEDKGVRLIEQAQLAAMIVAIKDIL